MEVCRKMQGDRIISALIGLVGAMSNNGKQSGRTVWSGKHFCG